MLSAKQRYSIDNANRRLNIWEGAVRSGKSHSALIAFLKAIVDGPPGAAMIVGPSRDSIQRNVISAICAVIPMKPPTPKVTQITLYNRTIHLVGASDERSQRKIQGSTLALAYVDEVTLLPEGFFRMLLSRLSVEGAMLFGTTNPDSPFHWLKRDFLDKQNLDMSRFEFTLDDNPALPASYVESLKAEYHGMWYQRYIEGKWVLADGLVYSHFDPSQHILKGPPCEAQYYVVGIDYGTTNPTAFVMIGYSEAAWPRTWVAKEFYWDGTKEQYQKTDTEYAEDLQAFIDGFNVRSIYLDPSAVSLRIELSRHDIHAKEANNDVVPGIRFVGQQLANGTLKICEPCVNVQRELGAYVWDTSAAERGEDKPKKQHDHCLDALRYAVFTHWGNKRYDQMSAEQIQKIYNESMYGPQLPQPFGGHGFQHYPIAGFSR